MKPQQCRAVLALSGCLLAASCPSPAQSPSINHSSAPAYSSAPAQASPSDTAAFQAVIDRSRQALFSGSLPSAADAQHWIATLGADGRWPDIDYADRTPGNWKTRDHMARVSTLARLVSDPKSTLYNNPTALAATLRALDNWTTNRYKNPNWYHNDIGIPMLMRDTMIALGDRLSGPRLDGALAVWNQVASTKIGTGGGANTIWVTELAMIYGAYTHDSALVGAKSKIIADEIKITTGEGIQSDFSFHEHGPRLQQFHYGGAFLDDTVRLSWVLHGTPWAIPMNKVQILAGDLLQGSQWMVEGTYTVPSTLDRSVSRPDSMDGSLTGIAERLRDILPEDAQPLDALIARQSGTGKPLVGMRVYPRSDFTTYHRPAFGYFLKTVSTRTNTSESINGENLKGQNLNCGDAYWLHPGDSKEYFNLQPVWDWNLLPGVTYADGAGKVQREPFVGAITDGTVGATAMDYKFGTKTSLALTARKFWACDGDLVVALIGDLHTNGLSSPVQTALDQCLLRGPVTVGHADGTVTVPPPGTYESRPMMWVQHAGFAYFPLDKEPITLRFGPASGDWHSINTGYSKDAVTLPVFMPLLEQGTAPSGAASGYVIAACPTPKAAAALAKKPTWQVLCNTADCQAVRFANGDLMAVFYQPGALTAADGKTLFTVDKPCLLLQTQDGLRLCDPTQVGGTVNVTRANGQTIAVVLPSGGSASVPVLDK